MSQENVEVIRDQFDAVNERDWERAMSHYSEDVELVVSEDALMEYGTFTGREAVGEWFGNWFRTFAPGYSFDRLELHDLGDRVLLIARHHGRGRSSGIEVAGETGYVYTLRDGKIVRAELMTPEAAREAAGGED